MKLATTEDLPYLPDMTNPSVPGTDPAPVPMPHFAHGLSFYRFFWLFVIGGVLGFTVETLFALMLHGRILSRSNILFTPINLIYGLGAMVLYLCLTWISHRLWLVFLVGLVVGTTVEFTSSWVQQAAFGTVSWDYSNIPLNIDGRVALPYSVGWGVLALVWVRLIEPLIDTIICSIPDEIGRRLTWTLFAILVFNMAVTLFAVICWEQRIHGLATDSAIQRWAAIHFPDGVLQFVYSNTTIPR